MSYIPIDPHAFLSGNKAHEIITHANVVSSVFEQSLKQAGKQASKKLANLFKIFVSKDRLVMSSVQYHYYKNNHDANMTQIKVFDSFGIARSYVEIMVPMLV